MKAITLWQPWASLVALGMKAHETRSWPTSYRGPLLIHSAKRWDLKLRAYRLEFNDYLERTFAFRELPRLPRALPLGAVVAIVELADCYPTMKGGRARTNSQVDHAAGDWSEGRFAWRLDRVRRLPIPIRWNGSQGLWSVPEELEERVEASLNGSEFIGAETCHYGESHRLRRCDCVWLESTPS